MSNRTVRRSTDGLHIDFKVAGAKRGPVELLNYANRKYPKWHWKIAPSSHTYYPFIEAWNPTMTQCEFAYACDSLFDSVIHSMNAALEKHN